MRVSTAPVMEQMLKSGMPHYRPARRARKALGGTWCSGGCQAAVRANPL
jgi:hypothetical protein